MILFNRYKVIDENKFRRFIFISILIISICVFSLIFTITVYSKDIPQYNYITVQEGDTLWAIASNYINDSNFEIRELVYLMTNENCINNASIYPGDIIRVPLHIIE